MQASDAAGSAECGDDSRGSVSRTETSRRLHKILVVDDDRAIRDMFMRVLSYRLPYCHVDMAVSGEEAISSFRSSHYDLLVMDMRMPEMNGDAAFHQIAEVCRCRDCDPPAVVFITGFEPTDGLRQIVEKDERHCLLKKPFKADELMNAIKTRIEVLGD